MGSKAQKTDLSDTEDLLVDRDYTQVRKSDILATIDAVVTKYELQKTRFNRLGNKAVLTDVLQRAVEQAKVNVASLSTYTLPEGE